jgi:tRNA A-37 threonylcarbamoyl transferase component Bud32
MEDGTSRIEDRGWKMEGGTSKMDACDPKKTLGRFHILHAQPSIPDASTSILDSPASMVKITLAGMRWLIAAEYRDLLLGPEGLRLQEWLQTGQAVAVKHGPHRAVYRVDLPGLSFYLKHNRVTDLRTWVRQLVRPSKAAMEFERAQAVAGRGIPTVIPLGLGEGSEGWGPSDNFLITRSLEDTEPLSTFIEQTLPTLEASRQERVRRRLARRLGEFLHEIHKAGIVHNDLHAGNILVRLQADDGPRLFLIDLHAVKIGPPLSWPARRANLVVLSHWFMIYASRTDRLRFFRSYVRIRNSKSEIRNPMIHQPRMEHGSNTDSNPCSVRVPSVAGNFGFVSDFGFRISDLERDLEARSWKSTLRLWRARESRYLAKNRAFQPMSSGVTRGHIVRGLDCQALAMLFADPDEPFRRPDVKVLKHSPSSTVIEFDLRLNGQACGVVYKRFRVKTWFDPMAAWFRRPAALRSWIFGHGLRECGLSTPRPLAVLFRRRWGLSLEGYLLTEKIPHVQELHRFVAGLNQGTSRASYDSDRQRTLRFFIDQVAQLVRDLHRRQLSHRDLKAANILVADWQGSGVRSQGPEVRGQGSAGSSSILNPPSSILCSPLTTHHSPLVWLIDLVGVKRHRRLSRRRRVRNLARLHASFFQSAAITRTDKLRFLRTYLQWGLFGRDGWKRYWREIEAATKSKIARTRRLRRPLG